jgi:hypothetical protein
MGARVDLTAGTLSVVDGPFAEAKEMISYALYQVRSKEEAIEWGLQVQDPPQGLLALLGRRIAGAEGDGPGGLRATGVRRREEAAAGDDRHAHGRHLFDHPDDRRRAHHRT